MIPRTLVILFAVVATIQAFELFVPDRQYRYCSPGIRHCPSQQIIDKLHGPKNCQPDPTKPKNCYLPAIEEQYGYQLAFIEYKDDGTRWDSVELEAAKVLIEEARKTSDSHAPYGGPIHLIMYVHGWANNADKAPPNSPRDVEKFETYLQRYVNSLKEGHHPVVGIYFAWRGRSLNLNHGLHFFSFWTRSAAARTVGAGMLYQDFRCLATLAIRRHVSETVAPTRSSCESETYPQERHAGHAEQSAPRQEMERSRVIVLAHSFGARVLETALIGAEPGRGVVAGTCKILVGGEPARPPVDLIIFENAATGARLIWRQYASCQPCGRSRIGCNDVVKVGNNYDFSKSVMVRSLAHDSKSDNFRSACGTNPSAPECQPYPLLISISGKKDWLTRGLLALASGQHPAAFLPFLQTHRVDRVKENAVADPSKDEVFAFEACVDVTPNGDCKDGTRTYMVKRKQHRLTPTVRTNAIWTMAVPRDVIRKHADVWNQGYFNFQQNVMSSHDPDRAARHDKNYDSHLKRNRIQ